MLINENVKKEIIDWIGSDQLNMLINFYNKYKTPFPVIVESEIPISVNAILGRALRNHINEKFNVVPNEIKDWTTYEDYIYNMVVDIIKEKQKNIK